jgi:hypothetical protein
VIAERGFLPELRRLLSAAAGSGASATLREVLATFRQVLSERAQLLALFFSGASGNARVRAGLDMFVDEGRGLLADYLASRVAAGEIRDHDTGAAAHMLFSAVVLGQVIGAPPDPASLTDLLLNGLLIRRVDGQPSPRGGEA